jgi:hypothetical protein
VGIACGIVGEAAYSGMSDPSHRQTCGGVMVAAFLDRVSVHCEGKHAIPDAPEVVFELDRQCSSHLSMTNTDFARRSAWFERVAGICIRAPPVGE